MLKAVCGFLYYKVLGWKADVRVPDYDKYILCVAPHTSNLDFLIGQLFYASMGRKTDFLMKKEWFIGPLGALFRHLGGIPVYRDKKTSLVEQLSAEARKRKIFHLAITPEGTRAANPNWKRGFYYIALNAGIPIVLVAADYAKRCVTMERALYPCGDIEKDMCEIKRYFQQFKGRHPDRFAV